MSTIEDTRIEQKLDIVLARLDETRAQIRRFEQRQRALDDLIELGTPMVRVALDGAIETLGELERAGYFAFAREIAKVFDKIVRSYSAEDIQRLGEQVVGILDTVRNVTQPDVLALVNDVAGAVHEADDADPKGMWGLMRAGKDPDVRKGMGVMVGILKQVGRAADKIAKTPGGPPPVRLAVYQGKDGGPAPSWVRHLAARRVQSPTPVAPAERSAPAAACAPSSAVPAKAAFGANATLPPGYGLDGFMKDPSAWTRAHGEAMAELLSLPLTEAHWSVLTWARGEYESTHASPNVRRLSIGSGISIRELYGLFPGKPGVLVAMIAGIPKPGGCL